MITVYDLRSFFHVLSISYLLLFLGILWFVLAKVFKHYRSAKGRVIGSFISFFCLFMLFYGWSLPDIIEKRKRIARYREAKAIFDERCKGAGWKIYRTVKDVEGITLLKVRPDYGKDYYSKLYDPMWEDAAFEVESTERYYIRSFLTKNLPKENSNGVRDGISYGYQFVDVLYDNEYIRYMLTYSKSKGKNPLIESPVDKHARYGVTYENMVDPEDRKYWIAGTKVIVLDTKTHEVLGEAVWYAFDPAQGLGREYTNSGTPPWSNTYVCPRTGDFSNPSRLFADKVLQPPSPQTDGE